MLQIDATTLGSEPCLCLQGDLTIYTVSEARERLGAALEPHPSLVLNLAGVQELDTAGVQLLAWLKQEAGRRGRTLSFTAHSPAVLEVMDLLKVAAMFGDPILIAPVNF